MADASCCDNEQYRQCDTINGSPSHTRSMVVAFFSKRGAAVVVCELSFVDIMVGSFLDFEAFVISISTRALSNEMIRSGSVMMTDRDIFGSASESKSGFSDRNTGINKRVS